jgi:hypothetical protein
MTDDIDHTDIDHGDIDHTVWDAKRIEFFDQRCRSVLNDVFAENPWITSAALCVAQYWDDEAADAVHARVVFSRHDTPDLQAGLSASDRDPVNLEGDFDHWDLLMVKPGPEAVDRWSRLRFDEWIWDSNGEAISHFACFCLEGATQCHHPVEVYRPWAVIRRDRTGGLELDVVGAMVRPWLDGVNPEWVED